MENRKWVDSKNKWVGVGKNMDERELYAEQGDSFEKKIMQGTLPGSHTGGRLNGFLNYLQHRDVVQVETEAVELLLAD